MRVFDKQKDSIITTYTRFSRQQNFSLTVVALIRWASEERKQRPGVDFMWNNNTKLRWSDGQVEYKNNLPEAI